MTNKQAAEWYGKLPPDAEAKVAIVDGDGFWGKVVVINAWDPNGLRDLDNYDEIVQELKLGQPYVLKKW